MLPAFRLPPSYLFLFRQAAANRPAAAAAKRANVPGSGTDAGLNEPPAGAG